MPDNAHIAVRHTSILLLGELCDWIGKHLECLPATLEYLNIGLQNSELSSAAGHALQVFSKIHTINISLSIWNKTIEIFYIFSEHM